jgi:hypothetical protein
VSRPERLQDRYRLLIIRMRLWKFSQVVFVIAFVALGLTIGFRLGAFIGPLF